MRYSDTDRTLLKSNIGHDVVVSDVVALFTNPIRSEAAIIRQGQNLGYGIDSKIDGMARFTKNKGTRNRKKRGDTLISEEAKSISRAAQTAPEPTILESLDNFSDDIVADYSGDTAQSTITDIYEELDQLLNDERYPLLQSLSVTLKCGSSVKLSKGLT